MMQYIANDETIYTTLCCFCKNSVIGNDVSCVLGFAYKGRCARFALISDVPAREKELVEKLPDQCCQF